MSDSIKERFLKEHELPMDQLEKVSGGAKFDSAIGTYKISCSTPGCMVNLDIEPTSWDPYNLACPVCKTGTLSYEFTPYEK